MKRTRIVRRTRLRPRAKGRTLVLQLDALAREIAMIRAGAIQDGKVWLGPCPRCRFFKSWQWAHVFSRRFQSIRWEPDNAVCICAGCHLWAHHKPLEFADWIVARIGAARIDRLRLILASKRKTDLAGLRVALQQELSSLTANAKSPQCEPTP